MVGRIPDSLSPIPCFIPGLPSRHCVFTCQRCGKSLEFHRWAFVPESGFLHYFFGKCWPLTYKLPFFKGENQ